MSKIKNAHKRFRQGRTTYKKLKSLVNEEIAKHMKDMQLLEEKFKGEIPPFNPAGAEEHDRDVGLFEAPHVHDENCHHFVKYGEPEEHIHNADCDHEHHQAHPHPRGE